MKSHLLRILGVGVLSIGLAATTKAAYLDPATGLIYDNFVNVPCPLCYTMLPITNDGTGAQPSVGAALKLSNDLPDFDSETMAVLGAGFGPALYRAPVDLASNQPVPVPAAVWLLGSALIGLGLIRRRP